MTNIKQNKRKVERRNARDIAKEGKKKEREE